MIRMARTGVGVFLAAVCIVPPAWAQQIGSFSWQLQPFCNVVTVNVTPVGAVYTLDGFDNQCGAAQRAPLTGLATQNPDGTIGLGLHIVTVPGGAPVHVDARIGFPSLAGSWSDSEGNSGVFAFGAATGGAPRPLPTDALAPGSVGPVELAAGAVTAPAIATGAVGAAALAPNSVSTATILNGTIGAADVDLAQIQRRLAGECGRGSYMTSADSTGALTCDPVFSSLTALGVDAAAATTGIRNTAVGYQALLENTTGMDNTAVGSQALQNSTASWNTAVGSGALFVATTGGGNVAVGDLTLQALTTSSSNVAIGSQALRQATGTGNIAVGTVAGSQIVSGNTNIDIGHAGFAADNATIRIGSPGVHAAAFIAGIRDVTTATAAIPVLVGTDGQLGTISSSRRYKEDIQDMGDASARLFRLRPVTFRYTQAMADGSKPLDFGLVAEEVAEVFPELAVRNADGEIETVQYHKLPALLLNELQRQQRVIGAQAAAIAALEDRLAKLEAGARPQR